MHGNGPIYSSESALKITYGNVGGQKICSPAAGFRPSLVEYMIDQGPSMCKVENCSEWILIKTLGVRPCYSKFDYRLYNITFERETPA